MIIVLMGVSGAGKTVVGQLLAEELGWSFYDADDFHPRSNIEKMTRREALSDEDRRPWLEALRALITQTLASGDNAILACSALKSEYREYLLVDPQVRLVYLKGSFSLIQQRLDDRRGHFMTAALLQSQFDALEEPSNAIVVDVSASPQELVRTTKAKLGV